MPELGAKHECFRGARFYDLGKLSRPARSGANQKDAKKQDLANEAARQAPQA
jgi:hypothetical protein